MRLFKAQLLILIMLTSLVAKAKRVDAISTVVNDQIITLSDLDAFKKKLKSGGLVDDALLKLTDTKTLENDRNALLNQLIDERLIDSDVKRKNMEVTIERVEQEIRSIATNNNITRQQLEAALKAKGVSVSQYQDFIKTTLERQSLIEREVSGKIRISDDDVNACLLAKHGVAANQIFEYELSHILFTPQKDKAGEVETDDKVHTRAKLAEDRLRNGEAFEHVAEQMSNDPAFSKGGEFGTFRAGEMTTELEATVRGVPTGEHSEVIKAPTGYQIIKVNKRNLIADPKMDEERETCRREAYADNFKRQFKMWIKQRRDDSTIRINGV